jgi:phosphoglycolate phosphatase
MDAIFFDLDGTLTDPAIGITRSIRHALRTLGHPVPEQKDLLWCIGPPMRSSLCTLLGGEAEVEAAMSLYRARYSEIGLFENTPYEGVAELLTTLKAAGQRLFLATSKPAIFAERILDHFALRPNFEAVFGAAPDGSLGDKTLLLRHALAQCALDGERCVMVGDRSFDMVGARGNAMTALGVLYGFGSADELRSAGAHHLCATPLALGEQLRALSS